MKYIKQFAIIITFSFAGEVLRALLPLPVPASIYGLVLMLLGLVLHIIPLDSVKDTAKFLVEVMPLMFIPAAVGLTESWDRISPIFWNLSNFPSFGGLSYFLAYLLLFYLLF